MIPIKIELKNFLSYGDEVQAINFKDYPLICFSGKNGHGKSALLDAITWGIWGQARKISGVAKADKGLLRLGQTQMMVSIEFEFNKNIYRVRREFLKTYGRDVSNLDFEVFNEDKKEFVSLTDKTIRATQAKIDNLLGLDFDTFINSAFLRQGQANEFSQKSPRERKQILTNILGLDKYDELKQKALENSKKYNDKKIALVNLLSQADVEIEKEKTLGESLEKSKQDLKELNLKVEACQKDLQDSEKLRLDYLAQKQKYDISIKNHKDLKGRFDQELEKFKKLVSLFRSTNKKSLNSVDVSKLEKEKNELLDQDQKQRELQKKELGLQEEVFKFEVEYHKKYEALKKEVEKEAYDLKLKLDQKKLEQKNIKFLIDQKKSLKEDLGKKASTFDSQLKEIDKNLKDRPFFEKKYLEFVAQFEKRRSYYQVLIQRGNWTKAALDELNGKFDVVHKGEDPSCPLCEQLLTVKRKQFLAQKFGKDKAFYQKRLSRISTLIKSLKEILVEQNKELQKLKVKDEELKKFVAKKDDIAKAQLELKTDIAKQDKEFLALETQQKTLQKEFEKLSQDKEKLDKNSDDKLQKDKDILKLHKQLQELKEQKEKVKYDKKKHDELCAYLEKVTKQLKDLENLKKELLFQQERKDKIHEFVIWLKDQKQVMGKILDEAEKIMPSAVKQKELEQSLNDLKNQQLLLNKQKEVVFQSIGSHENELKRIKLLKDQSKKSRDELKEVEKEIFEYQTLATIFGKDGIQTLLIEDAIPQIEEEANSILSKLTDNQAQIFIESLRDLKKGGVKETLDIKISDAVGIRPYELFSGGEAFRIDFALRIAISKLLAQRAGTALQTLIIDEGFGSQDEEGLRRLMDSIYKIQADFSKIIVVSHLPIFKDNFPVHFVVEKMPNGSHVTVVERG